MALKKRDSFISRKDYSNVISKYKSVYSTIVNLSETKTLANFCVKNKFDLDNIKLFLDLYENFEQKISSLNQQFIKIHLQKDKKYFDNLLKKIDPKIHLDKEQREAILNDEDYCLIIAGAGAGKTTTIAGKVRYLVERKNISPKEILVISFTKKAVKELKERINQKLNIPCKISTFHSIGYEIVRMKKLPKIISDNYWIINNYLSEIVTKDKEILKNLILFFGYYINFPSKDFDVNNIEQYFQYRERNSFVTLKSALNDINEKYIDIRTKKKVTINSELLKSIQEVQIANFLYLHNIFYVYEKSYKFRIKNSKKIYTPDFYIKQGNKEAYIEHFGISESGYNSMYTKEELERYKSSIFDKIAIHKRYGTTLIYTYSSYNDGRPMLEHLKEALINHGFVLKKKSDKEVYSKIVSCENEKYIFKFARLASMFIYNFKRNGYSEKDFSKMRSETKNARSLLFLDIIERVYLYYQKKLKEENAVDFEDMINESARLLREVKALKNKLSFKYVIVDEYQDISRQRFNFTKALYDVTDAKIIAVGDDWQSIYGFAGSDITLFTKFSKEMGYGDLLKITHTYRNSQELINIAGSFIQKNNTQIKKKLQSPHSIIKPIVIFSYSDNYKENKMRGIKGIRYEKAKLLDRVIGKIVQVHGRNANILLLGRYAFDCTDLINTNFFSSDKTKIICNNYPSVNLQFLTVHSAKGLSADNVIIINASNSVYGFPSQIEEDPVLHFVTKIDKSIDDAEERRLFYVALTRTKNRVFILVPERNPSKFVLELINDYNNITIHGRINKSLDNNRKERKYCPKCGYPLLLRQNKVYKQKLFICTNEPELCDFVTNDIRGCGNIHLCDKCDGYMVVKKEKNTNNYFMGCTNYKPNGTGCNNVENIDYSKYRYYKK